MRFATVAGALAATAASPALAKEMPKDEVKAASTILSL